MYRSRNFVWLTCLLLLLFPTLAMGAVFQDALLGQLPDVSAALELEGSMGAHGVILLSEGASRAIVSVDGDFGEQHIAVTFHIYDHEGRERLFRTVSFGVEGPPHQADLDLSILGPGWFRIQYHVHGATDPRELSRGSRDVVILKGRPESSDNIVRNALGFVNTRVQPYEAYLMRHLGADWLYEAATPPWAEVQFQPGGMFIWRARSESIAAAADAGLAPVGNVGPAPTWMSLGGLLQDPYLTDFYRFIHAYNQQASGRTVLSSTPLFDSVLDDEGLADYIKRLKLTSAALRDADVAGKQVIEVESLSPHPVEQLVKNGAVDPVDIVLVHLPETHVIPEQHAWDQLQQIRREWRSVGSGAELWTVTPNRSNTAETPPSVSISLFGAPTPSETERQTSYGTLDAPEQAQWLIRSHVLQLAHGVERIFTEPFSTGPSERRLFTGGAGAFPDMPQRPRPVIAAYATMAELLADATYMGQLSMPANIWAFLFSKHGEPVLVVWTTRTHATLELNNVNVPAVWVTDMMGAQRQVEVTANRVVLPISPSPQYVLGLDIGIVAQVLVEQFSRRLDGLRDINAEIDPGRLDALADRVYALATNLWLQAQVSASDLVNLVPTWYETVDDMLQLAQSLVGGGQKATGALYEVYDLLAVLAELGAMMGVVHDAEEHGPQVQGTDALLSDAHAALQASRTAEGALPLSAWRLMEKVQTWWARSAQAPDGARVAWAIVAREAAALAMMQGAAETPTLAQLFLLTESTEMRRPYPGFQPYEPFEAAETILGYLGQLIPGWAAGTEGASSGLTGTKGLGALAEAGTPSTGAEATDVSEGWDELPLPVVAVNTMGRGALSSLVLDRPEGWLWRVGDQILGDRHPDGVFVELAGQEQQGQATPLDMSLLVPYGAEAGTYEAVLTLTFEGALADQIHFTVYVEEAQATHATDAAAD